MTTLVENWYRRWEGTIQLLILFMIPLAVYWYGGNVSRSVQSAKTEQNYVRIATGILSQKVEKNSDQTAIRTWAADVLQRYSPVELNNEQRGKLISGAARLRVWTDSESYYNNCNYFDNYDYHDSYYGDVLPKGSSGNERHDARED